MTAIPAGQTATPEEEVTAPPLDDTHAGPPPPEPAPTPPSEELNDGPGSDDDTDDNPVEIPEVVVDEEEELEPKTLPVTRKLVDRKNHIGEYEQKGLTYFGKIELYGMLGRAVEVVMEGDGLGIGDLMDMTKPKDMIAQILQHLPDSDTSPDAEDQGNEIEAGKMLAAFAKVVAQAPEMLLEAYCIALAIPKGHRKWAIDWGLPDGVDDEMGVDILETFIDQNWGVMEDFFTRELPKIFKRAAKARARHKSAGGRSKP